MERQEGRILKSQFPDVDVPEISVNDFLEQHSWLNKPQDSIAVIGRSVGPPDASKEWRLSYRELRESVRRVASGLARRGLRKGDVVFVCSSNCPEYVITMLAVYSLGAVLTSAISGSSVDEILYKLGIAKFCGTVKFLVVSSDELTTARKLVEVTRPECPPEYTIWIDRDGSSQHCGHNQERLIFTDHASVDKECIPFNDLLEDSGDAFPKTNRAESGDLAVVLYSSGTTGPPKGIPWTHKQLVANLCTVSCVNMRQEDVVLVSSPQAFGGGMYLTLHSLAQGAVTLSLPNLSNPGQYSAAINKYKVTYTCCLSPLIVSLVKQGYELPTLQRCDASGGSCSPAVIREARITHPHLIINSKFFGMSEVGSVIGAPAETDQDHDTRGCLLGKPLANTQIKVVDAITKKLLPPGVAGEMCVHNPYNVLRGYINNPEATARAIDSDGWLHTGDLVQYDDDGFIYYMDRLKDIIRIVPDKSTTIQVSPSEMENILMSHPGVGDVAVTGIPDPDNEGYELIRAFVVRKTDTLSAEDLIEFVKEKTPRKYVTLTGGARFLKNIPKNLTGKNMRSELQAQAYE
ncbi:PREDICTED: 4-coumarate--CoA ligase 4-like [Priapulus caudatus]|uniref:4-coumarate--CoA ligase 4-like n=1 Tax=Priapulus caudatus TaxID=37621 RepID=A0ABM1DSA8_PRICU|nr:PREDICTED: 4-coumarate--CoA ligase 4-like [Priapulus caudatus]